MYKLGSCWSPKTNFEHASTIKCLRHNVCVCLHSIYWMKCNVPQWYIQISVELSTTIDHFQVLEPSETVTINFKLNQYGKNQMIKKNWHSILPVLLHRLWVFDEYVWVHFGSNSYRNYWWLPALSCHNDSYSHLAVFDCWPPPLPINHVMIFFNYLKQLMIQSFRIKENNC